MNTTTAGTVPTGGTAPGLTIATVLFLLWALLTLLVRAWVKVSKSDSWGSDDTVIATSFLAGLGNAVAILHAINQGYGKPFDSFEPQDITNIDKAIYASQLLYVAGIGLTKTSTSVFTARFLTRDVNHVRMAQALIAACGMWTAAAILAIAIREQPLTPWNVRDGNASMFARWVGVELSGYLVEIIAVALSIHFVWGLNMPLKKRLSVSAIFAFRLLIAPVIAVRLYLLSPTQNHNRSVPNIAAGIFTEATLQLTFVLASITCLKPFLRPFHSGYAVSAAPSGRYNNATTFNTLAYSANPKHSRTDPYVDLSTARSATTSTARGAGKDGGTILLTDITTAPADEHGEYEGETPLVVRPDYHDNVTTVATATHGNEQVPPPSKKMSISMTKEWGVRYDDSGNRGAARRPGGL